MRTRAIIRTAGTCLTCKYWDRHADLMMGTCQATNLPLIHSYRAQLEDGNQGCYQFGEERPVAQREDKMGWGRKVCAYYDLAMADVTR
jgi:hypothetical protein